MRTVARNTCPPRPARLYSRVVRQKNFPGEPSHACFAPHLPAFHAFHALHAFRALRALPSGWSRRMVNAGGMGRLARLGRRLGHRPARFQRPRGRWRPFA